jgi:hypothetical protein
MYNIKYNVYKLSELNKKGGNFISQVNTSSSKAAHCMQLI